MTQTPDRQPLTHRFAALVAPGPLSRRLARLGLGTLAAEEEARVVADVEVMAAELPRLSA